MMNTASKQRPVEKENWIRVENTHEPIIDRQLWDKVQKLLTKKHRDIDLETNKNIFAGFIKCGDCGRAMMKNFWRRADGSKSYSFYCGTYKRSGKDYCTPHTLPFQVLNDIVLGDLKQIIRNVENLQELVKSQSFTATKIRKSTDIELTKLKAELERVKKLKKSIYEDYKDELISKEEFLSYREDYQQKETLYSKQIETLEEKKKESVTEDVFETPWLRRLLELKDIEELDRDKLDLQTVQQAEHEEKLRSIQDSKRHLYEQYALGEIDLETYRTRKAVYDTELVQAKNVHAVITAQTKQIKSDYEIKLKFYI